MSTFAVTTTNWNSAAFWSAINTSAVGNTLDFSALPSNFAVTFDDFFGAITISDGSTSFTVKDSASGVSADATLGGASLVGHFDTVDTSQGGATIDGGGGDDTIEGGSGADAFYSRGPVNLVTNGSFEDGNVGIGQVTGWTLGGNTASNGQHANGARATDGTQSFAFGGWSNTVGGTLSQNVDTENGETHTLTFDVGATQGSADQVVQVEVFDGSGTVLDQTVTVPAGTTGSFSYTFTATSSEMTLRFTHIDGEEGDADLDNVVLLAETDGDDTVSGGDGSDTLDLGEKFDLLHLVFGRRASSQPAVIAVKGIGFGRRTCGLFRSLAGDHFSKTF